MIETLHASRRRGGFAEARPGDDRLPPHSPEAERGVLGCCLLDGNCVGAAVEYFQGKRVFYDLRHQEIFEALCELHAEGKPIDMILVRDRLEVRQRLEEVGGLAYLNSLPDTVPSAANLTYYLEIVWEKYEMRQFLAAMVDGGAQIYTTEEGLPAVLAGIKARVEIIERSSAQRAGTMPARLKDLSEFEQAYLDMWFGSQAGEPGLLLPECFGDFPFKVRRGEMSFLIAEKGAGKSTLLAYVLLHLMSQGEKACIASMEMKAPVTIKLMAAQLLGRRELPDTEWGRMQSMAAYEWLRERLLIYDFTGIADWREILQAFDFAALKGFGQFQIDSIMRLGIADDDYAEQGMAAKSLANWAQTKDAHLWVVNHLNKSDRSTKQRSRGSQQWIDNSNNVMSVHMNEEKGLFMEGLREELRTGQIGQGEFDEKAKSKADKFDSYFDLHNQRWPGSRQNGRRYLYFHRDSLQLCARPFDGATNWLGQWSEIKK